MKFLGLRLCEHDSNISYFDGKEIKYYKSERDLNIKHHGYNNFTDWKNIIKKLWGIKPSDLDDIAIVVDPWRHNLPTKNENFFPSQHFEPLNCTRVNHHYAHALSLELIHPTVKNHIVIDGFGDLDQAVSVFKNGEYVERLSEEQSGSIGVLFSEIGQNMFNLKGNYLDIAGKLMGLQSYGKCDKKFLRKINRFGIENIREAFRGQRFIDYKKDLTLATCDKLNWITTIHEHIGNALVKYFKKHFDEWDDIGYSGGVAMNVVWNTKLLEEFPGLKLIPHCADEGLSLGALNFLLKKNNIKTSINNFPFCQSDETTKTISKNNIKKIAKALSENKLVAWYQGPGEIGARALGHRSLLFNPFHKDAKEIVNQFKQRENYRPFGASLLAEDGLRYITRPFHHNPYMLFTGKLKNKKLKGITHVDGTCRYQTVVEGSFYELLKEFKKITGESILLNTSLNMSGKPIMGRTEHLKELLNNKNIQVIVYGDNIIKYE